MKFEEPPVLPLYESGRKWPEYTRGKSLVNTLTCLRRPLRPSHYRSTPNSKLPTPIEVGPGTAEAETAICPRGSRRVCGVEFGVLGFLLRCATPLFRLLPIRGRAPASSKPIASSSSRQPACSTSFA